MQRKSKFIKGKSIDRQSGKRAASIAALLALSLSMFLCGPKPAAAASNIEDGTYKVVSALHERLVWDIEEASQDNGGNLQLYEQNTSYAQQFIFTRDADGYYKIENVNSGKAVDCELAGIEDGTNVQQYASNDTDAQRWSLVGTGDGYYMVMCKCNGKVVEMEGDRIAVGANLQIGQRNGADKQKFKLVKIEKSTFKIDAENLEAAEKPYPILLYAVPAGVCIACIAGAGYYSIICAKKGKKHKKG